MYEWIKEGAQVSSSRNTSSDPIKLLVDIAMPVFAPPSPGFPSSLFPRTFASSKVLTGIVDRTLTTSKDEEILEAGTHNSSGDCPGAWTPYPPPVVQNEDIASKSHGLGNQSRSEVSGGIETCSGVVRKGHA